MLTQTQYRLMGTASWGIAINISAEWTAIDVPPVRSTQIADGVWFTCEDDRMDADELRNLTLGVKMVSQAIAKNKPVGQSILIKILDVEFNPTDYQPEGLVAAVANWAAEIFKFPRPEIIGIYDKERRKYIFTFVPQPTFQADETARSAEPIRDTTEHLRAARQMLDRGELAHATQRAGNIVRIVLQRVIRDRTHPQPQMVTPATIEHLLTVISRLHFGTIPARVRRHGVRVATWDSDLSHGTQNLTMREAESYLNSAETVVAWAKELAR